MRLNVLMKSVGRPILRLAKTEISRQCAAKAGKSPQSQQKTRPLAAKCTINAVSEVNRREALTQRYIQSSLRRNVRGGLP